MSREYWESELLLFFTDTVQAGEAEPTTKDEAMPDFKNKSWARPKTNSALTPICDFNRSIAVRIGKHYSLLALLLGFVNGFQEKM